jgi:hypothetical protein
LIRRTTGVNVQGNNFIGSNGVSVYIDEDSDDIDFGNNFVMKNSISMGQNLFLSNLKVKNINIIKINYIYKKLFIGGVP